MKKYLITGGAGFIGSNFVKYVLKKEDVSVINMDKLEYAGNLENLKEVEKCANYKFIHGDVCDEELLTKIFSEEDIDYVVHFAAMTHVDRSIEDAKIFVKTNVEGTLNLLNCAKKAWEIQDGYKEGKKFLYISTDEVYGDLGNGEFFTEETPVAPRNPYSASKAGAEMLVRAYRETHRMPINITRCSNNYGPNQFPEKLIPLLINNCLNHRKLPIYGNGLNVRDWLFVEDHCIAIDAVINQGIAGEIYNIGGHNEKTALDIAKIVVEFINDHYDESVTEDLIEFVEDRKGHDKRYAIDPTKTNEQLDWRPATKFEDGIVYTIQWYLDNQEWLEHVVSGEYTNYYLRRYGK